MNAATNVAFLNNDLLGCYDKGKENENELDEDEYEYEDEDEDEKYILIFNLTPGSL